jgi:MraZ protein
MVFIGRYYHALEQKGRLSIPVTFRSKLGNNVILTTGLDGCLFLLEESQWETVIKDIENAPLTKKSSRDWSRYLSNNAVEVQFDQQGRILIPEHLRELAKLEKETVIAGSVSRVEIWDRDIYHTYLKDLETRVEAIAETMVEN